MIGLYIRFTTAVLNLVNPYISTDKPPSGEVWRYIKSHVHPLKLVLLLSLCLTVLAASIEVWLISYAGTLIDTLATTSSEGLLEEHSFKL